MATIRANTSEKIYPIRAWLGLNENPDGDTKLKMGEAAVMRNFKITRDGNLQRRAGLAAVMELGNAPVRALWKGIVTISGVDTEVVLAACNGKLWKLYSGTWNKSEIGSITTSGVVHIFGFDKKAYILDGSKYRVWDGATLAEVTGYTPTVIIAASPTSGAGTQLEQINKLTAKRTVRYSPDGTSVTYQLPETDLNSVDAVRNLADPENPPTISSSDLQSGTVTFSSAPALGTDSLEIDYSVKTSYRSQIEAMRYSELYNGAQDTRVFLYGDGSNKVFYSGLDQNGAGRADYFPDLNVANIGTSSSPVTALIRHYSRMIAFKTDSTYAVSYGTITLEDGSVIPGFSVVPVNRTLGNAAPGQARLVLNSPRTIHGQDCYEWRNNSSYSSNLTVDERQAKRISDRVYSTLETFSAPSCVCWDDDYNQEYYIAYNGQALVHNYAADAWYYYTAFDATAFVNVGEYLYIGRSDGRICRLAPASLSDDGVWVDPVYDDDDPNVVVVPGHYTKVAVNAYWESGSMAFGKEARRKYSSMLWVGVKPQSSTYLEITAITDQKKDNAVKTIVTSVGGFVLWDFNTFSFADFDMAKVRKHRIKAKKFTYYKLVFSTSKEETTATVLSADLRVRDTGYVK